MQPFCFLNIGIWYNSHELYDLQNWDFIMLTFLNKLTLSSIQFIVRYRITTVYSVAYTVLITE